MARRRTRADAAAQPGAAADPEPDEYAAALRHFVERFAFLLTESGVPRMPARVFAYALAEDADRYTAGELARGLGVSPAAVSGAVRYLVRVGLLGREREPGNRNDIYRLYDDDVWGRIYGGRMEVLRRYEEAAAEGAAVLGDRPGGRRMRETEEFFAFIRTEWPEVIARWREHRARLADGTASPRPDGPTRALTRGRATRAH